MTTEVDMSCRPLAYCINFRGYDGPQASYHMAEEIGSNWQVEATHVICRLIHALAPLVTPLFAAEFAFT